MIGGMHPLLIFLNGLPAEQREPFASRCGTTVAYLRKAISTGQPLRESLCINIERESAALDRPVLCEQLRPTGVDWAYLRNSKRRGDSPEPGPARAVASDGKPAGRERDRLPPGVVRDRRDSQRLHEHPDLDRRAPAGRAGR
jgi:DNA-binding transcriptional regulator YdaS (Cro superfamily)